LHYHALLERVVQRKGEMTFTNRELDLIAMSVRSELEVARKEMRLLLENELRVILNKLQPVCNHGGVFRGETCPKCGVDVR